MNRPIAIVGTAGIPARYGGFETLAEQLARQWSGRAPVQVYCQASLYPPASRACDDLPGIKRVFLPIKANGFQSLVYDGYAVVHAALRSRSLLLLGVSGAWILPFLRLTMPWVRVVTNVDGIEWKRAKWSRPAAALLRFLEAVAVRFSHVVIADNEGIRRYLASNYGVAGVTIAYGADHLRIDPTATEHVETLGLVPRRYDLALSRIEPENNCHVILEAYWGRSETLVYLGNWNSSPYGRQLRARYANVANISLLDPDYDTSRISQLRAQARLYVHGHSAGGTNPSLVEAMMASSACICFDCEYNRFTTDDSATYFADKDDLRSCLDAFAARGGDAELLEAGRRMGAHAHENYRWEIIASRYAAVLLAEGLR